MFSPPGSMAKFKREREERRRRKEQEKRRKGQEKKEGIWQEDEDWTRQSSCRRRKNKMTARISRTGASTPGGIQTLASEWVNLKKDRPLFWRM